MNNRNKIKNFSFSLPPESSTSKIVPHNNIETDFFNKIKKYLSSLQVK